MCSIYGFGYLCEGEDPPSTVPILLTSVPVASLCTGGGLGDRSCTILRASNYMHEKASLFGASSHKPQALVCGALLQLLAPCSPAQWLLRPATAMLAD